MMPPFAPRLVLLAAVCLALTACKEDPEAKAGAIPKTHDLAVATVAVEHVPVLYSTPGNVTSSERIEVAARTTGYIQSIVYYVGDTISKGDVLVEFDPTEVNGEIKRAQAALNAAETTLADAERDFDRLTDLQGKGVVSNENLRKARVARDYAYSITNEAQAAADIAVSNRKYTTIKSPIDGIVIARPQNVGDLAAPGDPVLTIESRDALQFKTSVSESQVRKLHVDDPVKIRIDALQHLDLTGTILRVVPSGDPVTRRYDIEIALPEDIDAFPGMFGRAQYVVGYEDVPVIPQSAVVERGGLKGVFVVPQDNTARFRWLSLGAAGDGTTKVNAGLVGGETIVAQDSTALRDGDKVVIVDRTISQ